MIRFRRVPKFGRAPEGSEAQQGESRANRSQKAGMMRTFVKESRKETFGIFKRQQSVQIAVKIDLREHRSIDDGIDVAAHRRSGLSGVLGISVGNCSLDHLPGINFQGLANCINRALCRSVDFGAGFFV